MTGMKNDTGDSRECEAMRKMFVGGLNRDTTEEVFNDHFGQYGTMLDSVIIKDGNTRTSRGFGFVTYQVSDSVEKVFQARPHVMDGKTLDCKRAMPRDYNTTTAHAKTTKLFVGGVGPDLTPEVLREYIENRHPTSIGSVEKIDLIKDKETNKNKGFGFIECSDNDFADRLTISENSFDLNGKKMGLKKAEPKPESGDNAQRGGSRGGRGGFESRGRGRGSSYGPDRSSNVGTGFSGSGYKQSTNDFNNYSTGYPVYGANSSYQQGANAQGNYGQGNYGQGSYGQGNYGQGNYGQGNYGQGNYGQGNNGQGNYGQTNSYSYGGATGNRYQPY